MKNTFFWVFQKLQTLFLESKEHSFIHYVNNCRVLNLFVIKHVSSISSFMMQMCPTTINNSIIISSHICPHPSSFHLHYHQVFLFSFIITTFHIIQITSIDCLVHIIFSCMFFGFFFHFNVSITLNVLNMREGSARKTCRVVSDGKCAFSSVQPVFHPIIAYVDLVHQRNWQFASPMWRR